MVESQNDSEKLNQNLRIKDASRLECQVAGHSTRKGSLDFLRHKDGYVLKPMCKNEERDQRELEFYEEVSKSCDPVVKELQNFIPKYFGTTCLKVNGKNVRWIVLKNVIHEFKEPCIMDVKIGSRTWDPLATEEKRASEEAKYRASKKEVGFCIPGFQVYKISSGELVRKNQTYGKTLDGKSVRNAIKTFLNSESGLCRSLVLQFLAKLWKILRWFRTQEKYLFYSSSILLAYDAAELKRVSRYRERGEGSGIGRQLSLRMPARPLTPGLADGSPSPSFSRASDGWHDIFDKVCKTHSLVNNYEVDLEKMKDNYKVMLKNLVEKTGDQPEVWVSVTMIDFAHVFHSPSAEIDHNYLNGLQNLVNIFEDYLEETDF